MHANGVPPLHRPASPPVADSVTVGLWHMDESVGSVVADSGPNHLDGAAGLDTQIDFGRFGNARRFTWSRQSFVYVPYSDSLETGGQLSVEAWVYITAYGPFEDTPIAGRWTEQANEQSWLLSIVGNKLAVSTGVSVSPGYHLALAALGTPGQVMFALQAVAAGGPQSYFSTSTILPEQWTHVGVTYDGELVRIYVDGRLDSQYILHGLIRGSTAPLEIGNYFDPRLLSDLEARTPVLSGGDPDTYYAFQGMIDELRVSSVARPGFPNAVAR